MTMRVNMQFLQSLCLLAASSSAADGVVYLKIVLMSSSVCRPSTRIPLPVACCTGEAPSVWKKRKESSPYSPFLHLRLPQLYRIGSDAGFFIIGISSS